MGGVDKKIFENLIGQKVQIVNDEHFTKIGTIKQVFDSSITFFTEGKTIYLSFDRVKEIRPLRNQNNYNRSDFKY